MLQQTKKVKLDRNKRRQRRMNNSIGQEFSYNNNLLKAFIKVHKEYKYNNNAIVNDDAMHSRTFQNMRVTSLKIHYILPHRKASPFR